jgi:hypothetical protein
MHKGLKVVVGAKTRVTLKLLGNEGLKVLAQSQVQALRVSLALRQLVLFSPQLHRGLKGR